jgi:hypothetical protein
VYIGRVGRLEVCQAENELRVFLLVDCGAARGSVHPAVEAASFQNVSAASAKAVLILRTIMVSPCVSLDFR